MFNFSANHLLLLSRMEYRSCVVFLMQDHSTRRVYRLYDFTKSQIITSDHFYCVSGKVNSADKLYLVIESVKRDTKHSRIRSYAWSGRRGRSAHELTINADRQKARTRDCLFPTAADASVCAAIASQSAGSFKTGQTGSLLNRR
jgi:hypothetical protein